MNKLFLCLCAATFLIACKKDKQLTTTSITSTTPADSGFHTIEGRLGHMGRSTIITTDQHLVVCGTIDNGGDVIVAKTTVAGDLVWKKLYKPGNINRGTSTTEAADGFLVCGTSDNDYFAMKLDKNGEKIWTKTYGGSKEDYAYNIITTKDGNYLIGGNSYSFTTEGFNDIYLVKIDANGNKLWDKSYPLTEQQSFYHVLETSDGDYFISADNYDRKASGSGAYFLKVDKNGNKIWDNNVPNSHAYNKAYHAAELNTGEILACSNPAAGNGEIMLYKINKSGQVTWQKSIADACWGFDPSSFTVNTDGTIIFTGQIQDYCIGSGNYNQDILLLKTDASGNKLWQKKFGRSGAEWGDNILKYGTNYIVTGFTDSYNSSGKPGEDQIFIAAFDANGDLIL